jgi:N-acetylglucosamine kinase-like BadF-type ATPase
MTFSTASSPWVLGADSGGSGLRLSIRRLADGRPVRTVVSREPVRTGPSGIDAGHLLEQLLPAARSLLEQAGTSRVEAVALGVAGMATLGVGLRAILPRALAHGLGARRIALAADAVTAYAGALGQRSGAVVAAGTGLIGLGATLAGCGDGSRTGGTTGPADADSGTGDCAPAGSGGVWRRADGWGHLLGDCGGGAWIGRAGLEAALRAHDGRDGGSAALLARLEEVFGPAEELPGRLYPRTDRPAVLASFAPDVARCAAEDPVAEGILRRAARAIAETAAAVCPAFDGAPVALTGGLLCLGEPLLAPLRAELALLVPHGRQVEAAGDPLDGAVRIAAALATDGLMLPVDSRLLWLPSLPGPQEPVPAA